MNNYEYYVCPVSNSCIGPVAWSDLKSGGAYQGLGARSNGFEAQPRTWVRVDGGVNQKKGGGWKSGNWVFLKSGVFDPGGTPGSPGTPALDPCAVKALKAMSYLNYGKGFYYV